MIFKRYNETNSFVSLTIPHRNQNGKCKINKTPHYVSCYVDQTTLCIYSCDSIGRGSKLPCFWSMIQYGKHGHDRGMDDTESLEWNVKKRR